MAVKYLSGNRIWGTDAERLAMTTTGTPPQTSWKELGRYTLTGEADTINVGSGTQSGTDGLGTGDFTAKDNLMILTYIIGSGTIHPKLRFNGVDDDEYASRISTNGGTDWTDNTQDAMRLGAGTTTTDQFIVTTIRNNASTEKLCITQMVFQASGTLSREETVSKWANTSDQVVNIQVPNTQSGGFASGSEVVVLGCDDDEADGGTNFWQEIGTDALTEEGDVLTTGTITAKKYLMIETHQLGDITSGTSANCDMNMTFNDTTSGYATTQSQNGASDTIATGTAFINGWIGYQDRFSSSVMINVASKDKLAIGYDCGGINNYGSDTSPPRDEWVGEWDNTSNSITKVTVTNSTSRVGEYGIGSSLKVWGSN